MSARRGARRPFHLPRRHRHERHRVIAENIDYLHRDGVTAGPGVGVRSTRQFQLAALACAGEFCHLVIEYAQQRTSVPRNRGVPPCPPYRAARFLRQSFSPPWIISFRLLVMEIHRPIIHPVRPLLRQRLARDAPLVGAPGRAQTSLGVNKDPPAHRVRGSASRKQGRPSRGGV